MQENEIESIRKKANIIDIIASYIPLTQKGKNYFGVCPFHDDHSPSMSVNETKQIYKCFSCGASGNVFSFVKDYENVSFIEAVKIVAEKCGLSFQGSIKTKEKVKNNQKEIEIMALALKFYQNNLNTKEGKVAKQYLQARGLNEQVIKDFDLGLALGFEQNLNALLLKKNYSEELMLEVGLVNKNKDFLNDAFHNRILFPIHNLDGDCVGFTGRIYHNEENQAKYINSKESVIFKKGQILFNYHRAKTYIKHQKELILVEGNMDAIRMYASGIKNVVALMGTSLTSDQAKFIKNLRVKVVMMFDNDLAGENATYQNGLIFESLDLKPWVIRLSNEKDPDEYIIKNGIEAMLNNLKSPVSFLDFKLNYLRKDKDLTKTEDLVLYIKELTKAIQNLDTLTQEVILKKTADEYQVSYDLLKQELLKLSSPQEVALIPQKKIEESKVSKVDKAIQSIIYYMISDSVYITKYQNEIGYFSIKKYRDIANEIVYYYNVHQSIDLASFITFASIHEEISETLNEIMKVINVEELSMNAFEEMVQTLKKEEEKRKIKELKLQIASELDANKKIELATKLVQIKKGCVGNE